MLELLDGRRPAVAGELAVTDGVADLLDVELGSTTTVAGRSWVVVGMVENPAALGDEFALVRDLPRPPDMTVAAGTVVLGPSAISILGRAGRRARVAVRLALRDLDRYRSRSGAALAAITLTTGIAVAAVVTASAAVYAADEATWPSTS